MKEKVLKTNIFVIILTSLLIVILLSFVSYKFFMQNFEELEKEQNIKNLYSVLDYMDKKLSTIGSIINDYAQWDDTYNFIATHNKNYIYENFREGSNTLEGLDLDFLIFTTLDNKRVFSSHIDKTVYKRDKFFDNDIIKKFNKPRELATLYKDSTKIVKIATDYFYVVKKPILNTDGTTEANGFIYGGKLISNELLNSLTKVFDSVSIENKTYAKNNFTISSKYLKNATVKVEIDTIPGYLKNTIQFYDFQHHYVLSIVTKTKRTLIQRGKETIFYYNLIISVFLLLILFLIFKNLKILEHYNDELEIEVKEKTKELLETNERLRQLSEEDELTKINNRRNFFKLGSKALQQAIQENKELTVIMIDLDNFKGINDKYGHKMGDKVLTSFANIVSQILGKKHIFARLGGEEFAIIFEDISSNEAYELTQKIRAEVEKYKITLDNFELNFTVSIGFCERKDFTSLDDILQNADVRLYEAKNSGKNRIIRERRD